jgi:hypothetical protein
MAKTKGGRELNPADAARKEARKKEIKRNKLVGAATMRPGILGRFGRPARRLLNWAIVGAPPRRSAHTCARRASRRRSRRT